MYDSVTQPCKNLSKNCTNYNHVLSRRIGWKWNTAEMTDSTSEKARVRHTIILVDRQTDRQKNQRHGKSSMLCTNWLDYNWIVLCRCSKLQIKIKQLITIWSNSNPTIWNFQIFAITKLLIYSTVLEVFMLGHWLWLTKYWMNTTAWLQQKPLMTPTGCHRKLLNIMVTFEYAENYSIWYETSDNGWPTVWFVLIRSEKKTQFVQQYNSPTSRIATRTQLSQQWQQELTDLLVILTTTTTVWLNETPDHQTTQRPDAATSPPPGEQRMNYTTWRV